MEIEKDYSCIEQNKRVLKKTIDVDMSYQETLQAYCDDMYRIVRCSAHSYLSSSDINNDSVNIYCKTKINIVYYDENSCLCYADFDEEFTKTIDAENLSDSAFANIKVCDKYCSFRVINQRRIDINTSCSIIANVYDKTNCPCLCSCDKSKLKKEIIKSANIIATTVGKVEFDEEISIPSCNVKRIISAFSIANLDSVKIIKDKALIKSKVNCTLVYTIDNNEIDKFEYSFDISKIIDSAGITEDSLSLISLKAGALYFKVKNTDDESCVVQLYGDIIVASVFVEEEEKEIITDGYVLNHNSKCTFSPYSCHYNGKYINEDKQKIINFDFKSSIKEIKCLNIEISNESIINNKICAKATCNIICINDENELMAYSCTVDVELDNVSHTDGIINITQISSDYTLSANGKVDVRFNYKINAFLYDEKIVNILSELDADDDKINNPALTIHFGKKDEDVWSIAKSYSSDLDMIMKENELKLSKLENNKVLIIPGM